MSFFFWSKFIVYLLLIFQLLGSSSLMIVVVGSGTSTLVFHFSLIWVFSIYVAFHDFFEFGHLVLGGKLEAGLMYVQLVC